MTPLTTPIFDFSLCHKLSYDSAYDSDSEAIPCEKNLQLQLLLRPCSSPILLAGDQFLLVLVKDFVRGYLLRALPIGQVSYLSWTTGRDFFEPCFSLLCTCKKPFSGIKNISFSKTIARVEIFQNARSSFSCGRTTTEVLKYDDVIHHKAHVSYLINIHYTSRKYTSMAYFFTLVISTNFSWSLALPPTPLAYSRGTYVSFPKSLLV